MGFIFPLILIVFIIGLYTLGKAGVRLFRQDPAATRGHGDEPRQLEWRGLLGRVAPDPEAKVFRVASRRGGRLTVSDVVLDLRLPVQQSEELLNSLVDGKRVRAVVGANGLLVYEFPEIIARLGRS